MALVTRLVAIGLLCATWAHAQAPLRVVSGTPVQPIDRNDPLFPQGASGLVGQLHTITIITNDEEASVRFYQQAWGLRARGPFTPPAADRARQNALWGLPTDERWRLWVLDRPGAPGAAQIRMLAITRPTPHVRSDWTAFEAGPLSIGFAVPDVHARHKAMLAAGVQPTSQVNVMALKNSTGQPYTVNEGLFKAPDHLLTLAVGRNGEMSQIGPFDPATGIGGPTYSGQVIAKSDEVMTFYRDVLGFQVRRDMEFSSAGENGGLGLPNGTTFRFLQVFAPGSWTGYLIFLDLRDQGRPAPAPPRPPQRGLTMWTFVTPDLTALEQKLRAAKVPIVGGPTEHTSTELGHHRALTALAPNGFVLEFVQPLTTPGQGRR